MPLDIKQYVPSFRKQNLKFPFENKGFALIQRNHMHNSEPFVAEWKGWL